ncbi:MAG: HNH endonuclease [Chloroflexi bacterium]|nr:HNH endonuclease [Chloroflexota bacterium]
MQGTRFEKHLLGICPHCHGSFSLTGKGNLYGHNCNGSMRYGEKPVPDSMQTYETIQQEKKETDWIGKRPMVVVEPLVGINDETRASLFGAINVVEEIAGDLPDIEIPKNEVEALLCFNCGSLVPDDRRHPLYCTEFCRQVAETVRYHRRVMADGRYEQDFPVKEAIDVRLQKLCQGVVVRKNRISPALRKRVFDRTDGLCAQGCGKPATDLDHINGRGEGNVESNLQGLCQACHLKKSKKDAKTLSQEMKSEREQIDEKGLLNGFLQRYTVRVYRPIPSLICDNPDEWPGMWQSIAQKRRAIRKQREAAQRRTLASTSPLSKATPITNSAKDMQRRAKAVKQTQHNRERKLEFAIKAYHKTGKLFSFHPAYMTWIALESYFGIKREGI